MTKNTYLPSFAHAFGRCPKSKSKRLLEQRNAIKRMLPGQLPNVFEEAISLEDIERRHNERSREFSTPVVVWSMIGQALRGSSIRDCLKEIMASSQRDGGKLCSSSTSGLVQARHRLKEEALEQVHRRLNARLESLSSVNEQGRVLYVDGTSAQVCDTPDNQAEYPQPSIQKPGCGFPVMQQVALMDARTNAIVATAQSDWKQHESPMFQVGIFEELKDGDTLGRKGSNVEFKYLFI